MVNGVFSGIVKANSGDPKAIGRILVEYAVDSPEGSEVVSNWCRMCAPMAGRLRGLTMLPDVGTEVMMAVAYRSLTPYILGAVYNGGDDKPQPYKNDDKMNHKRVFWSRNDHMVIFDDEPGNEKVGFGAGAPTRLQVSSGVIHQILDSSKKTFTQRSDGDTRLKAKKTISIKCTDFKIEAGGSIVGGAGSTSLVYAAKILTFNATKLPIKADRIDLNSKVKQTPDPMPTLSMPGHSHGKK